VENNLDRVEWITKVKLNDAGLAEKFTPGALNAPERRLLLVAISTTRVEEVSASLMSKNLCKKQLTMAHPLEFRIILKEVREKFANDFQGWYSPLLEYALLMQQH
jgi:hypothetical protein